jgi:hypothetical protein
MTPYQKRVAATERTKVAFEGRPWKPGRHDCGQMIKRHLIHMGRPIKAAAKAGTYHSIRGATSALKRMGYNNLIELMDDHFERVPPAGAWVGDVIAMPGLEGPGALTVALGGGRVLGYHEEVVGAAVLQPSEYVAAWRVPNG